MAATAAARAEAMIQPMIRMTTKPMTLGMALSNNASAAVNEVKTAVPQSVTTAVGIQPSFQVCDALCICCAIN